MNREAPLDEVAACIIGDVARTLETEPYLAVHAQVIKRVRSITAGELVDASHEALISKIVKMRAEINALERARAGRRRGRNAAVAGADGAEGAKR